jgi:hypothetical protein
MKLWIRLTMFENLFLEICFSRSSVDIFSLNVIVRDISECQYRCFNSVVIKVISSTVVYSRIHVNNIFTCHSRVGQLPNVILVQKTGNFVVWEPNSHVIMQPRPQALCYYEA